MKIADIADEIIKDPYEFPANDSDLWLKLLIKAKQTDSYMFSVLVYLRDVGTSLVPDLKFGYVLKPIIDEDGKKGWLSMKQYNEERKWLLPYAKQLTVLLKEL